MKKLIGGFFIFCLILCIGFISLNDNNETNPKTEISETPSDTTIQKNAVEKQEKSERELLEEDLGVEDVNIGNFMVNEEITTKDE